MKNVAREKRRDESIVHTDEKGNLLCVNKSLSQGTLQDNTETLKTKADALTDGNQKKHLEVLALIAVARYIIANGPVVKTEDAGKLYMSKKGLETHMVKVSIELYKIFSQHLNIVQVYMFSRVYLIPNTPNLKEILLSLTSISHDEAIVKKNC